MPIRLLRGALPTLLLAGAALFAGGGCSAVKALGTLQYMYIDPLIPEDPIPAQYEFPAGTVAVYVHAEDSVDEQAPHLIDEIAQRTHSELKKGVPERTFLPPDRFDGVRRRARRTSSSQPYEQARLLGANTLLEVLLTGYRLGSPTSGDDRLAEIQALVRVIEVTDGDVIFPKNGPWTSIPVRAGRYQPAAEKQNIDAAIGTMANQTALRIARLFYTYTPEKRDIGQPPD